MSHKLSIRKHIFLCFSEKAKCASRPVLERSWEHLKTAVAERNMNATVGRTQANCLQVCNKGPVAVVFDKRGATWYGQCEPHVLDLILDQHIEKDEVVEQFVIAENTEFLS